MLGIYPILGMVICLVVLCIAIAILFAMIMYAENITEFIASFSDTDTYIEDAESEASVSDVDDEIGIVESSGDEGISRRTGRDQEE